MAATTDHATDTLAATAVASRYHRTERAVRGAVAIAVATLFVAVYLRTSLLVAIVVIAATLVVLRGPIVRRIGVTRMRTDLNLESVRNEFTGAKPPILALQWGIADDVRATAGGAIYEFSYLFGLRSATITLEIRSGTAHSESDPEAGSGHDSIELVGTVNGRAWGTYEIDIESTDEGTVVRADMTTDKRVGLAPLVQAAVARRYYDDALAAQGYDVLENERALSV